MQPEHSTELHTLLKLTWLLATIANRRPFTPEDEDIPPKVTFSPGIADRGQWGCSVSINFAKEGEGRGESLHMGNVNSCLQYVRDELKARLGLGYP